MLHMDMDAFFASVEQLTRPTVRGRPVLVGGLGPRGTVAGASYEAREYGARSAMPMSEARRRCPVAVVLPPRFRVYGEVSRRVLGIVREVSDAVQQLSVDEAFMEPGELAGAETGTVERFAAQLRARVARETGVTASIGAGSGKQIAKIASGLAKPDGALIVPPEQETELLWSLPVRKLWGVGPVSESKLHRIGVQTIGELAALRLGDVVSLLGQAHGSELHRLASGIDDHPVEERAEAKQVSAETTFDVDITEPGRLQAEVAGMADNAHRRLVSSGRAARTVTVKVRDSDFTTISRAETFSSATSDLPTLAAAARRLTAVAVPPGTPIRLVGVSFSGLATSEQEALFDNPADEPVAEPGPQPEPEPEEQVARQWRAGDDVRHDEHGHGWVQGAGLGRVTVRFETAATGRGVARTFAVDDPMLHAGDPLDSLGWS
ncbi:DNA polymerase IV [Saccharopolyspora taberi]|uniref:DNA polymerase IV n=1 Tax=Saccharopolyspora taberi TaxID=60895 RepID=A0ABN3V4X5_9PSEU